MFKKNCYLFLLFTIVLLLSSCNNAIYSENKEKQLKDQNLIYHYSEKLYSQSLFLGELSDKMKHEDIDLVASFADGYMVANSRTNLYNSIETMVLEYLTKIYNKEVISNVKEVTHSISNLIIEIGDLLNNDVSEITNEDLVILSQKISKLEFWIYEAGSNNNIRTNHDLNLYNLLAWPYQVKEKHELRDIKELVNEVQLSIDEIITYINIL